LLILLLMQEESNPAARCGGKRPVEQLGVFPAK